MTEISSFTIALFSLPLISALIGWFTNFIAIKMLFHPRKPISFGGLSVQGILPRRQAEIAVQLGRIVATDLLSSDDLVDHLTNARSREVYEDFIHRQANVFIREKLYHAVPLSRIFLRSKTIAYLEQALVEELLEHLPQLVNQLTDAESGSLNIQLLVEKRVRGFSTDRLEKLLHDILAKEFRFIELLGAVLGFIIGAVQMGWIFLVT